MGDRMFASEGDSVNVGRLGATAHADRWEGSALTRTGGIDATSWTARRLQTRLDRQQWLLDRHLHAEPAVVPELLEIARRMRRDTEVLQILCGADLDLGGSGVARRMGDAVTDAVSAADEPSRVAVRTAPAASIGPAASVEFGHLLSAVIDHVTIVYPDARVDLATRVEPHGGITVDIAVDGALRHEPDAPDSHCTYSVAEQLAARSRQGVELRRPVGGPPASGSGLVLSVHCPAGAVSVDEPIWPSASSTGGFRARTSSTGSFPAARGNAYPRANSYPGEQSGGFYGTDSPAAASTGGFYAGDQAGSGRPAAYSDPVGDGYRGSGYDNRGYDNGGGYDNSGGYDNGSSYDNDPIGTGYGTSRPGYADSGAGGNGYGVNGTGGYGANGNGYGSTGYADSGHSNSYNGSGYDDRANEDRAHAGYSGNGTGPAGTGYSNNGYSGNGYADGGNGYSGSGYADGGNGYSGSGYADGGNGYSGSGYADGGNGYSGNGNGNGNGFSGNGYADGGNGYAGNGNGYSGNGYADGGNGYAGNGNGNGFSGSGYADGGNGYSGNGYADGGNGSDSQFGPSALTGPSMPAYKPSKSSGVDELFGPLLDLPIEPMDDRFATPIFEAIASVWFRDDPETLGEGKGLEWESPNDAEWRAASERAVSTPTPESLTATGLPRRRPGGQLVPPPLSRRPAPTTPSTAERVPDRVRDRLSTYQRGLRQGRHRAPGENSEYGDW